LKMSLSIQADSFGVLWRAKGFTQVLEEKSAIERNGAKAEKRAVEPQSAIQPRAQAT